MVHRLENSRHKRGWKFVHLHHDPLTSAIPEVVGELHVDQRNLKDLTLKQWVHHGLTLIEQVKLRRELSDVIDVVSPSETPFMTEAREMNVSLHDWEVAKAKYIPKPKLVTREAIIDAIGCPNLALERVKHRDVLNGEHTTGFVFSYLKRGKYDDYEVLGQLEVDHPRLKDLTLEQWVENGQLLVDQVENT